MRFLFLLLALVTLAIAVPAYAHNEKMAGSKWFVTKGGLTAEIELAPSLLAEIKGIKEGNYFIQSCSDREFTRVIREVLQPYLDRKLTIAVNGKTSPVQVTKVDRSNEIMWKIWLSVPNASFDNGENALKIAYQLFFDETDDTHINISYLYTTDAGPAATAKDSADLEPFARTVFDADTRVWELSIDGPAVKHAAAPRALWATVAEFIALGIKHILTGYDHIAFLLALIVIGLSFKEVIKIITAFTVAHSITLLLAALQIVSVNSRVVEIVIAFSICYVAVENVFRKEIKYRWLITFAFGLIHGFGFASVLQELIKERSNLLPSVISFNVGVEMGQLLIFLALIPILYLLNRKFAARGICTITSLLVFAIGFSWLVERVFQLNFLPF